MNKTCLVLGGARSGKSRFAEDAARKAGRDLHYIATAAPYDDPEMNARIARHRAERGSDWITHEIPLALVDGLEELARDAERVVLVDCLTLWLSNLLLGGHEIEAETARLAAFVAHCPCHLVMVSNEVGLSIVPENALARRFRDEAGILNQRIAAASSRVAFMAAGLPLFLK